MSGSPPPDERTIQEVSRRPGGWAVLTTGACQPVFLPAAPGERPPAAGDRLRTHPDGRREVVRAPQTAPDL